MKLDDKQIEAIANYIDTFGIKYYELKQEFLDHIICSVEAILKEKQIDLYEAIRIASADFEPLGFRGIMEERQKELQKLYRKKHWNSIKDFFKFPQVVGTISLFISIYCILQFYPNALKTAIFLNFLCLFLISIECINLFRLRKKEKQIILRVEVLISYGGFLTIMLPQSFLNIINGFKDSLDMENIIVKTILSLVLVFSFLSVIVFKRVAKNEIEAVKQLYYA